MANLNYPEECSTEELFAELSRFDARLRACVGRPDAADLIERTERLRAPIAEELERRATSKEEA